jgi:hypothetical protein
VDAVGESPFENSACFAFGLAGGHLPGGEVLRWLVDAELGDSDTVQGSVGLAVAAPVETEPLVVPRPDGDRSRPVPCCVGVAAGESADVGGLADELAGGQRATSFDVEQRRGNIRHQNSDVLFELVGFSGDITGLSRSLCEVGFHVAGGIRPG